MMKNKKELKLVLDGLYVLSVLAIFLPWFTYDAKLMGYCCGYNFLLWLLVPVIVIGIYLVRKENGIVMTLAAELSMIANLVILVIAFGRWQETRNIITGFHWKDGFHTALPTYWITVVIYLALFILFQCVYLKKNDEKKSGG